MKIRESTIALATGIAIGISAAGPMAQAAPKPMTTFLPYKPKHRRPGTGYIKQIGPNTWEGRYSPIWPDGKKHSRNVYGKTREECEAKLEELIVQMKKEMGGGKRKKNVRCS